VLAIARETWLIVYFSCEMGRSGSLGGYAIQPLTKECLEYVTHCPGKPVLYSLYMKFILEYTKL
jgi:hypothetical protein